MMTDKGIIRIFNKKTLTKFDNFSIELQKFRSGLAGNIAGTGIWMPYTAIADYKIEENKIVLIPKTKFLGKEDFVITPNNNQDKILKIIKKYISK